MLTSNQLHKTPTAYLTSESIKVHINRS